MRKAVGEKRMCIEVVTSKKEADDDEIDDPDSPVSSDQKK